MVFRLQVSMPTWRLGEALCKLVPMVAGTNVFVSTMSITAIALDRFHLIVHPTDKQLAQLTRTSSHRERRDPTDKDLTRLTRDFI